MSMTATRWWTTVLGVGMAMAMGAVAAAHGQDEAADDEYAPAEPAPTEPAPMARVWQIPSPPPPPMAWVPAGHFRKAQRTPATVDSIVIHTTEGGWRQGMSHEDNQFRAFLGNINYFKRNDRSVSAHYVMGPSGEICVMVNETDIAHTQTYYNARAFGIECVGWGRRPETWTPEMLESLVQLCAYLCVKWEIPAYQPEGTAYVGPWSTPFGESDYRFNGPGLLGHYQMQPWNKSDPGPHFPWDEFTERVRARIREFGHEPIPLPEARPALAVGSAIKAGIKEDTVRAGEAFTYQVIVEGAGLVGLLEDGHVRFPDFARVNYVSATGRPWRAVESTNRIVYEVPLMATEARAFTILPAMVRVGEHWYDSGEVMRVNVAGASAADSQAP